MHANFNLGFRGYFLLATVVGITTFACGAVIRPHNRLRIHVALWSGAGLLAGAVLIVIATSLQGVSLGSLFWGVILNPLNHPGVFYISLKISRWTNLAALILAACIVYLSLSRSHLAESWWFDVVRCVVGVGAISLLTLGNRIQWVVPLLPMTLVPRWRWEADGLALFTRLFVTSMAVTQFLEPYPVAGSQTGIAAAPMILWAFVCIADGIAGLRAAAGRPSQEAGQGLRLDAAIGGAILGVFTKVSVGLLVQSQFPPASTGLRGSTWLHLPTKQATQFEAIAQNVGRNCSTLFTMPGMGSFNIWSGVPTPNGWNLTAWMKGIRLERQEQILSLMKSDPLVCAIVNRGLIRFWDKDNTTVERLPLARYIMIEMPKVAEIDEYEIHVHPHRSSPWLDLGAELRNDENPLLPDTRPFFRDPGHTRQNPDPLAVVSPTPGFSP
jgi:hypothetical protein